MISATKGGIVLTISPLEEIMSVRDWTDEELEEDEVKQLLKIIPKLHYYEEHENIGIEIYFNECDKSESID